MAQGPLVERQIEAGEELIRSLATDGFPVSLAFWAQESDDGLWFLYIASPVVDERGLADSYRIVQRTRRSMPDLLVDFFDIKLIGESEPIVRDLLKSRGSYRGQTQVGGRQLGHVSIDRALIYPPITVTSPS